MSSLYGTDPSYNYTHMYNIKDLRGTLPTPTWDQNTLLGFLHFKQHPFAEIIGKTHLAGTYNSPQADFSLFVPTYIDTTLDSYKLRQLVLYHTLEHAVPYKFLTSSGMMKVSTRIPGARIIVENVGLKTPLINGCSRVIGTDKVGNANIFYIDKPLWLDSNPLSNSDI